MQIQCATVVSAPSARGVTHALQLMPGCAGMPSPRTTASGIFAFASMSAASGRIERVDVGALSSDYEGSPLFVFECRAAKIPLVATAVPGYADLKLAIAAVSGLRLAVNAAALALK